MPGQEIYARTRRAMLAGVDGIVFVADASPDRADANRDSLDELREQLERQGRSLDDLPVVLQANKMDRAGGVDATEIAREIGGEGLPIVEAVAVRGIGVRETLQQVVQRVAHAL